MLVADLNPAWIALIGTVMGGTGLQGLKTWLSRGQRKNSDAADLRNELRLQIKDLRDEGERLRDEANQIQAELDTWKSRYWDLMAKYNDTQVKLMTALTELREEWKKEGILDKIEQNEPTPPDIK